MIFEPLYSSDLSKDSLCLIDGNRGLGVLSTHSGHLIVTRLKIRGAATIHPVGFI